MTLSGVDPSRVVVGNVVCKAGGVLPAVRRFNAQIVALSALEVSRHGVDKVGYRGVYESVDGFSSRGVDGLNSYQVVFPSVKKLSSSPYCSSEARFIFHT